MDYIMEGPAESARIRQKTSTLLIRHHLDWLGLTAGQSFVDFGCASGEVVLEAARITDGGRVVGLDGSAARLESARSHAAADGHPIGFVRTIISGPGSTPLADDMFDHAWTRFLLEYLPDPIASIREMKRVVRPGGKVTLIDIDGNCVWHYPTTREFDAQLSEVMADLAKTGFDPHAGRKLASYALDAGLVDIRVSVEPYHRIIGAPDRETAEAWVAKVEGLRKNYSTELQPERAYLDRFFDTFLEFIMSPDTMTWSNLYLVQGTKPPPP